MALTPRPGSRQRGRGCLTLTLGAVGSSWLEAAALPQLDEMWPCSSPRHPSAQPSLAGQKRQQPPEEREVAQVPGRALSLLPTAGGASSAPCCSSWGACGRRGGHHPLSLCGRCEVQSTVLRHWHNGGSRSPEGAFWRLSPSLGLPLMLCLGRDVGCLLAGQEGCGATRDLYDPPWADALVPCGTSVSDLTTYPWAFLPVSCGER